MNSVGIIFSCIVLLVVQRSTTAINCYVCNLGTDGCSSTSFNKAGSGIQATADSTPTYCTKTTYTGNSNNAVRYYSLSGTCGASTTTTTLGVVATTTCCSTDLCNSAFNPTASVILAMMAALVGFFLTK